MKKVLALIFSIFFLTSFAHAQAQLTSFSIGPVAHDVDGSIWQPAIDTADKRIAYGFFAPASKTVSEFSFYISSVSGSPPDATDGRIDIYGSKSGNVPDTSSSLANAIFDPSTTGWKRVTISKAVTAGTQYWFVFTNLNAAPATKNYTLQIMPGGLAGGPMGGSGVGAYASVGATALRSDAATPLFNVQGRNAAAAYRIKFSDNTYFGFPASNFDAANTPVNAADRIYAAREVGNSFKTFTNASMNLRCVGVNMSSIGTPTGVFQLKLYQGTSLVDTAYQLQPSATWNTVSQNTYVPFCFTSYNTLAANTTYRTVVFETTQSDANTDAAGLARVDWDPDSNSQALKYFAGTISKTVCTSSCPGGGFTDTPGSYYQMELIPEAGNEFTSTGGGTSGGLLNNNKVNGGYQ
jgi:hypothetical protein